MEKYKNEAYINNPDSYFSNSRHDYISNMPDSNTAKILEIGCGSGSTGKDALTAGKCCYYAGIDINKRAAEVAKNHLSEVLIGDVEELVFPWGDSEFDIIILSEVLEHLVDPFGTMKRISRLLKTGGFIMASSPNVCHYNIIFNLIRGNWDLTDSGVMDRTHLRWFTPNTFRALFEDNNINVDSLLPVAGVGMKSAIVNFITFGKLSHLFIKQISIIGTKK